MEFAELIKTPKVENVFLHRPLHKPTEVVLCITSHHMILSSRDTRDDELWVSLFDSKMSNHSLRVVDVIFSPTNSDQPHRFYMLWSTHWNGGKQACKTL